MFLSNGIEVQALEGEDLKLDEKGATLPQTRSVFINGKETGFFLQKTGFPSATSTVVDGNLVKSFLESTRDGVNPDGRWTMVITVGDLIQGHARSENFATQTNPIQRSRPSVHKIQRIQRIRVPINSPR